MKSKKYGIVMAAVLVLTVGMIGCGESKGADKQEPQAVHEQVQVQNPTSGSEDMAQKEEEPATEVTETVATETEETEAPQQVEVAFDGEISDDWTDMQFVFDGQSYKLMDAYRKMEANGWSFDLADYGYSAGYVMNPGDKVVGTIRLTNPNFDEDLRVQVGFKNNSDSVQDILDCDIWSFGLDTCYGSRQLESYPDMVIAKGIHIGSTKEEVEAAFGPCEDIYESELGYTAYSYVVDYTYHMDLTVYDDKGLTAIDISTYE